MVANATEISNGADVFFVSFVVFVGCKLYGVSGLSSSFIVM
jgi:hypothetical protein